MNGEYGKRDLTDVWVLMESCVNKIENAHLLVDLEKLLIITMLTLMVEKYEPDELVRVTYYGIIMKIKDGEQLTSIEQSALVNMLIRAILYAQKRLGVVPNK